MSGPFRPINNPPRTTGPWRPISQRRPARMASRNEPPDATRARPTARDVEDQRSLDDDNNTDPTDTDVDADGDVSMGAADDEGPGSSDSAAGGPGGAAVDIAAWQEQQQAMEEDSKSWSSSSPLRSSGASSATDDPGDDYGSKDERARAAGGKLTYGVELEFLMAVDAHEPEAADPHPEDGRWLARYLFGEDSEAESFQYTVRNRCVDALRRAGVVVNKTDEIDLRDYSMGASEEEDARKMDFIDSLEDMAMPDPNDDALRGWSPAPPGVRWDGRADADVVVQTVVEGLLQQFVDAHTSRGIALIETRNATVDRLAARLLVPGGPVLGDWPAFAAEKVRLGFVNDAKGEIRDLRLSRETGAIDPHHVDVPGMGDKYRAWLVTKDPSVSTRTVGVRHYEMPPGYVLDDRDFPVPPDDYRWWGAEVITPVYDTENRACAENIQSAVQQLREEFRIHKPMSAVRSGVHVHWGHQDGWTLLQLKRFASLWVVIEESLFGLHRSDRSNFKYCRSLREHSRLAYALSPDNPTHRARYRDFLPQGGSAVGRRYDRYMASRIPLDSLGSMDGRLLGLVQNIWRYPNINTLATAMSPGSFADEAAVRWNVTGEKRSDDPSMVSKQTLEFRMMQGTLDFEHIMHWMQVCHRVILFDNIFRTLLPNKPPGATVIAESNHAEREPYLLKKLGGKVVRRYNS
ncbi:hypothetical protein DL770_006326 [Monosporascus sp. CRB-9-2]|nr:hypothetical protein DL770_006326 [Monosporascus sp. CRB-9-2]